MNLSLHATGASFVAGKSAHNPRDLVVKVLESLPDADREEQFEQFRAMLSKKANAYQRAVDWYFFVNMRDYMITNRNQRRDPLERAQAAQRRVDQIEQIAAQIVMLDLTMPNGKAMRDCTGHDMATFGNRFGKIAAKVGKNKLVGAVLNEDQVRAIMK